MIRDLLISVRDMGHNAKKRKAARSLAKVLPASGTFNERRTAFACLILINGR